MTEIFVLDSKTIDKIAAGEVVERPASVVKELVENAIDAKSTNITVEIRDGGNTLIRVTDNGTGIEKSQIKRAFLRHATSKIQSVDDLLKIVSLGFRGEALSSIAAVSQIEFITKTKEELTGIRYQIEGAKEVALEEIGAPEGSTIIVRNLFYNTPARKKFLKSPITESAYISDIMEHLALSMPEISFKFVVNGQTKFHTSGNHNLREVIYKIHGKEIIDQLIEIESHDQNISLTGYIGKPVITKGNRSYENYFVNHRYIKSEIISKAIEESYKAFMMQHKYPFVILHLEINPEMIDINVHPAKMDIRFTNQNYFYDFITSSIYQRLKNIEMIPQVSAGNPVPVTDITEESPISIPKIEKLYYPEPFEVNRIEAVKIAESPSYKVIGDTHSSESKLLEEMHQNIIKANEHILVEKPSQVNFFEEKLLTKEAMQKYNILGQIFDTYWLVAFSDKLFLIDQHAAHEKVLYERIMNKMQNRQITSQNIMPPVVVTLSGLALAAYNKNKDFFTNIGFEIEDFGGNELAIRSIPTELFGANTSELFNSVLDELMQNKISDNPRIIEEKIASMSCKAAVKGNNSLVKEELQNLLEELMTLDNPYHCPHGRPTIISMTKYEIDKKFKRIL